MEWLLMPSITNERSKGPREFTGSAMLGITIAFFGVIAVVNAVMVYAATTTFGGLETESAYKEGLAFGRQIEAARTQAALHWQVVAHLSHANSHATAISMNVRDQAGAPLSGLDATVRLVHPTDKRFDRAINVKETAPGSFRGVTDARDGQWDLVIELQRDGERMFRSKNRVSLR
jgi:nitrogen fixation protein FixH